MLSILLALSCVKTSFAQLLIPEEKPTTTIPNLVQDLEQEGNNLGGGQPSTPTTPGGQQEGGGEGGTGNAEGETEGATNGKAFDCNVSGCAKMYPADNISELHHRYEAGGNPCAFNNCAAGDPGSCSYGSSQLACSGGGMKDFLSKLQSNKSIWKALGGGTYDQMVARACTPPATNFASAWKSLCSDSSTKATINQLQEDYMKKTYYDAAAKLVKDNWGLDFNSMSPELQMSLYSAAVALGTGGASRLIKSVKNNIGDPKAMSEEELLIAMYHRRDYFYGSSSPSIRASVQRRNAREGAEALESLQIRKAWEAEQQKPKDQQKTYEQIVQEVTGRPACTGGQAGNFDCKASGALGGDEDKGIADNGKNCAPSQYLNSYQGCLFCPIFAVIFNAASTVAKNASNALSLPILAVVIVGWAIWIAFVVIKYLYSFQTQDGAKLLQEIFNKSFVVVIVAYFLKTGAAETASMFIEPVFNTGFKLAQMFAGASCNTSSSTIITDGGLPASMGQNILCTIQAIQNKLISTMALGMSSICVAIYVKGKMIIFPSLPYLFSGILIIAGAFIMMIIYPFLLMDCVLHLCIACALIPFALGVYPFKITRKFMKPVWDTFVSCMFKFIFISLIVLILTNAIQVTLDSSGITKVDDNSFVDALVKTFVWSGVTIIKVLFVLLLGWCVMGSFNEYAGNFTGSIANSDFGAKLGGMAGNATKSMGKKLWGGAKKAGGLVAEASREKMGDMKRDAQSKMITSAVARGNGTQEAIMDKSGNVIGYKYEVKSRSLIRGREKTKSVTIMNNGTKMITSSKKYSDGRVVTTKTDGYLKQVETTKDGKVVSNKVSVETAGLRAIRNTDGSMNMASLNMAMRDSAFSPEMVKATALKQYAEESFAAMGYKFDGQLSPENIKTSVDKNGNEVLELTGEKSTLRMTLNSLAEMGGRPLVELATHDKQGNLNIYATDGMFNKHTVHYTDEKTGEKKKHEKFAMSEFYAKQTKYPVDYDGNFANIFNKRAPSAFSEKDIEKMRRQFISNREKNKQARIGGIK